MKIMVGSLREECMLLINVPETAFFGHFMPSPNTAASNKCPAPSQRKAVIILINARAVIRILRYLMMPG